MKTIKHVVVISKVALTSASSARKAIENKQALVLAKDARIEDLIIAVYSKKAVLNDVFLFLFPVKDLKVKDVDYTSTRSEKFKKMFFDAYRYLHQRIETSTI